jgi:hypothetical protein
MCLGPKEAVFEKPEELSQYLKTLYIRGNPMEVRGVISMELTMGRKSLATMFFIIEVKVTTVLFLVVIGFMPIIVFLLLCTTSGSMMRSRQFMRTRWLTLLW